MTGKTVAQLEAEISLNEKLKEERKTSDKCYAPMIVKTIVFGAVGIALAAILGALISLVVIK